MERGMERASDSFFGSKWLQSNTMLMSLSDGQKIMTWVKNLFYAFTEPECAPP